jgi:hypothetical protein
MSSQPGYVAPAQGLEAFHCPRCDVYAHQRWETLTIYLAGEGWSPTSATVAECAHCQEESFWFKERMIDPVGLIGPLPHPDMSDDVRADYEEARAVVQLSPRSAAALLRLALQKLCAELGEPGKNINNDIAALVAKGLPPMIQQAADALRVIGNEAVHPGELDLRDDQETVGALFGLLNAIVDDRIARPKQVEALYRLIPPDKRAGIEIRDGIKDLVPLEPPSPPA